MSLTSEQIDAIADKYLIGIFQEMEQDVLSDIARRVRKTGRLTETAELMAQSMARQGFSPAEIRSEVMKMIKADAGLQAQIAAETLEYKKQTANRIKSIVEEAKLAGDDLVGNAGTMSFNDDLSLWREAHKELTNTALPQIVEAARKQTWGMMKNLTMTTALGLRDASGVPVNIMDAYHRFLDKATLEVATGVFSYDEAVNRVIKEMAKSGVRLIEYNSESGRTTMTELDVAVRRNVRTGVSQMAGRIMEENLKNSDTDLVITSQHMGSRPEHAVWQNKIFSFSGKSKRYPSLKDGTGYGTVTGLKGANCTHNFYPYWQGLSVKEPDLKEPPPVEVNGRQYTYYQATQKQRAYERKLRSLKRETLIQENSGGSPAKISELKNKTRATSREYNSFSNAAGLKPKPNRTRVAGFDKPIRTPPTNPNIKKFTNPFTGQSIEIEKSKFSLIRETCGDEFTDGFVSCIDQSDDLTQALYHKFGNKMKVIKTDMSGHGAHYDPDENGVALNINEVMKDTWYDKAHQTSLHEFGHMINSSLVEGQYTKFSSNKELYDLIMSDGKDFVARSRVRQGVDPNTKSKSKDLFRRGAEQLIQDSAGHRISSSSLRGVADMLEPVTGINDPLYYGGHGLAYWKSNEFYSKQTRVTDEFMAHVLEGGADPDFVLAMETVFPNATEYLRKMLWEALL